MDKQVFLINFRANLAKFLIMTFNVKNSQNSALKYELQLCTEN